MRLLSHRPGRPVESRPKLCRLIHLTLMGRHTGARLHLVVLHELRRRRPGRERVRIQSVHAAALILELGGLGEHRRRVVHGGHIGGAQRLHQHAILRRLLRHGQILEARHTAVHHLLLQIGHAIRVDRLIAERIALPRRIRSARSAAERHCAILLRHETAAGCWDGKFSVSAAYCCASSSWVRAFEWICWNFGQDMSWAIV